MSTSEAAFELEVDKLVLSAASCWPTLVFKGLIGLFFGILLLVYADATLFTITRVIGAFLIIDSVFCFFAVILLCRSGAAFRLYGTYVVAFLTSLTLGIGAIVYPGFTAESFLVIVGVWFLVIGLSEIVVACILRQGLSGASSSFMMFGGLLYAVFAILILTNPAEAISVYARIAGIIIVLFGLQLVFVGLELRRIKTNGDNGAPNLSSSNQATSMV
mmetsp:Transcript_29715/g.53753  ORF Transcript_29715/g.53753 Transcript_29715/m.53753 type:complete len:217 (+) Transcript_29715:40-690(+)